MEHAPLLIRNKVAMIKFWLKTIDLPEDDGFRLAYERARALFADGNKIGVEVPKAIFETLSEVDFAVIWEHQTPQVLFEGDFSFLKELKRRLQSEDKNFPKLPLRNYKKPKVEETKVEKGQLDQAVVETPMKKPVAPKKAPVTRNLYEASSNYITSEAAGHDVDPFTSMFLLT